MLFLLFLYKKFRVKAGCKGLENPHVVQHVSCGFTLKSACIVRMLYVIVNKDTRGEKIITVL